MLADTELLILQLQGFTLDGTAFQLCHHRRFERLDETAFRFVITQQAVMQALLVTSR